MRTSGVTGVNLIFAGNIGTSRYNSVFGNDVRKGNDKKSAKSGRSDNLSKNPVSTSENKPKKTDEPIASNPASKEQGLSQQEKKQVEKLKKVDRETRAHEQAHVAAGGSTIQGGVRYKFKVGPDGKKYAVGGHVNIDISPEPGDPKATIRKMQQVRKAALAPADPSPQDRAIAQTAAKLEAKARAELREENAEETGKITSGNEKNNNKLIEKYTQNNSPDLISAMGVRGVLKEKVV